MVSNNLKSSVSRIGVQTLLLGVVPLAFLVALLLLALAIQEREGAVAAQSQMLAQVIAETDHELQLLGGESKSVVDYHQTHRPASLAAYNLANRTLPAEAAAVAQLVRGDKTQYAQATTIAIYMRRASQVLTAYVAAIKRNDQAAQTRIQRSPEVAQLNKNLGPAIISFTQQARVSTAARLADLRVQAQTFTVALVGVSVIGVALTVVVLVLFGVRVTRRLAQLAANAFRLAEGLRPLPISGNDEITALNVLYEQMTAQIRFEQHRSSTLQQALLPQMIPSFPGLRLDVSYAAAAQNSGIGGDWYDVFRLSETRIGISVGDVAGHGFEAAALMATARHAIRTVGHLERDPAAVMQHVNQILCRNEMVPLVTALYATLDLVDGTFQYCLAGHPPPMVVRTGRTVQEMPGGGLVLGVDARSAFHSQSAQLDVGSAVVLYTDGIIESCGNYFDGIHFLQDAIEAEYRNGTGNIARAIQDRMLLAGSPRDDSALMFIGVTALGEAALEQERVAWTIDARIEESARRVKRAVLWHLGEIAVTDADLSLSELVVAEMIGNVARHTPGPAVVTLEWKGETATVRVIDRGERFEPPEHQETAELLAESGRGIFLMRAISPDFNVQWTGDGNCVSAVLPITIAPAAHLRQAALRG